MAAEDVDGSTHDQVPNPTSTLTLVYGQISFNVTYSFGQVAPLLAGATLAAYALACFTLPVILTRRRDVL